MPKLKLKFKKLNPNAVAPKYAHETDACFDLVATSVTVNDKFIEYGTGLAFEIPKGYVGLLFPRSSITNKDLILKNSVGVIDPDYRGEVKFRMLTLPAWWAKLLDLFGFLISSVYSEGDRIGQMMIIKKTELEFEEVLELSETERGTGGYGSTDKPKGEVSL